MVSKERGVGVAVLGLILLVGGCIPSTQVGGQRESPGTDIHPLFLPPSPDTIPGDLRGEDIRMGYLMVVETQQYGKRYVGNALNCTHCHLDAGLHPNALSFVGISVLYPEYRERAGRRMSLMDQINDCFERNMNGTALPPDSTRLSAIVAYIEWLSKNVPRGSAVPWRGLPALTPTRAPDAEKGKTVYEKKCAFCHGADGQGAMAAPPLWGDRSYTIGSDMARVSVAASFIKANMPRGRGWSITDEEAFDVAAYINSRPRPDFSKKVHDWPQGGKPADVPD
ncbi:MAG: c-type cytochrome [Nitrospira sp.]|nr:c-type cytochrome [Nitrospira sp.]